ncbi:hypothetical protein Golax_009040, partial [Gossypium laxum]|nr:hypothetical protein [Gossypium laxum]
MKWLKRGIGQHGSCSLYQHGDEDLFHVLRDCLVAREVWLHVVLVELQSMFFAGDLTYALLSGCLMRVVFGQVFVVIGFKYTLMGLLRWMQDLLLLGVINKQEGEWILGFNRYLGLCSVFDTKLWGILHGLILVQKDCDLYKQSR